VDAIVVVEWLLMTFGTVKGEGRNRRRRANDEHLCAPPVINGGRIVGEPTVSCGAHGCSLETSTDDNRRHSVD